MKITGTTTLQLDCAPPRFHECNALEVFRDRIWGLDTAPRITPTARFTTLPIRLQRVWVHGIPAMKLLSMIFNVLRNR
ncbi:hypothetical protein DPMN_184579 [Dreissena polymorpha]|uniref:Uncharacterized protein n=1 Tax=Dreissena polymorpha TaxID=45954 RepID=A0A9D4DJI6_DREPO|nr:hypothetical protein DPMN_184579 [Dreissena polymorpha]